MATSGSYDYSRTAAQIVARVAKNLGALGNGGTIDSDDETYLLETLNIVAKELSGDIDSFPGDKVWTRQVVTLFLAKGQQSYLIGPASSDARATTLYGRTTIDAAEALGQTVISVTATSDTTTNPGSTVTATASDIIGVEQDDGTIHWSTVSSISAGDTITIADATTAAAAVGNYVWWFTSRAQRFPVIESAVLRDENNQDLPLEIYRTRREYDDLVDKYADGRPSAILVEPQRITTRVTLDTQPTDVTDTVVLTVKYPSEDYDATSNDIAFPQEYFALLEWETTLRACPTFGKQWTPSMERNHALAMSRAAKLNPEQSSVYYEPGKY